MLFFIELAIIEERVVKIMRSSIMKKSIIVAIILLILFGTLATLYINNLSDNLYSETDEYLNDLTNQTAKAIKNRINENLTQLTMPEVFYMATKGGGEFLGKVGSFFFTF